jgi:hypothetical protein
VRVNLLGGAIGRLHPRFFLFSGPLILILSPESGGKGAFLGVGRNQRKKVFLSSCRNSFQAAEL